jgi:hypothetical protein
VPCWATIRCAVAVDGTNRLKKQPNRAVDKIL